MTCTVSVVGPVGVMITLTSQPAKFDEIQTLWILDYFPPSARVPAASDCPLPLLTLPLPLTRLRSLRDREPVSDLGPPLELTPCRHSVFTTLLRLERPLQLT